MIKQRTLSALWSLFLACNAMVAFEAHAQSPIAYYPMNGDSLTLQVVSTYALEGTIHGSPESCEDRFGNPNGALNFEPGDYVTIPGSSSLNPLPFSVSVWYKPDLTANQVNMPLFKKYYPALWNGMMMYTNANGGRNFLSGWYIRNSANRVISQFGSPVFAYQDEEASDDMWRHAVFTVDSVEGRLYFDGQLQDVQPWDGQAMASTNSLHWQFAGTYHSADTLGYEGAMDDLAVWNHALTEGEVWELYSEGGFDQNGCTDPAACNYDFTALVDNGLCLYPVHGGDCLEGQTFCADGTWWNPNDQMCHPFPCISCPGDFNADHQISVVDMLGLLGQFGETCEPAGCSDELACNFNPLVLVDDGSCVYGSVDSCGCLSDCQGNLIGDLDGDGICDNAPSTGCGDSLACNYSADLCLADSALCIYGDLEPGSPCDDGDPNTFNDVADASGCNCAGTPAVAEDGSGPCEGQVSLNYFGHDYLLLEIADRCWFRQNLGVATFANGDSIAIGLTNSEWASTSSPAMAISSGLDTLTGYSHHFKYNYFAVVDERGLCPSDWYVPSNDEWLNIIDLYGGLDSAGLHLKASPNDAPSNNGDNLSGFTGKGSGWRHGSNGFYNWGAGSHYYTSTLDTIQTARALWKTLAHYSNEVGTPIENKRFGLSVRCIKSETNACFDPDGDGVCPEDEISGCTDEMACNYNAEATHDNGSCIPVQEAGSPCDDGDDNTFNDTWDAETCACTGSPAVAEDGSGPCVGEAIVVYHGYEYPLVEIGDQCWFRENLRAANYTNGDSIPSGLSNSEWSSASSGASAIYGENPQNLETFGRLYNWFAVNDSRGMCPSGWHVPADSEWMELEMALGVSDSVVNLTGWRGTDQGTQMKSIYGWNINGNGTNSSGFNGFPGGSRYSYNGVTYHVGDLGEWWSSSENGSKAWFRTLSKDEESIRRNEIFKGFGFSVRCISDNADTCFDPDGDGVCPEDEISGCTDETACNYDEESTQDDGSCIPSQEAGSSCDDGDDNTFNDTWDAETCACAGTPAVAEDGSGPCEGALTVNYQGYDYQLVEIGDQCWFRENCKFLPAVSPGNVGSEDTPGQPHAYVYGYNGTDIEEAKEFAGRYDTYGVLYNHYAAYQWQLCPVGWHEATSDDWRNLEVALGLPDSLLATGGGAYGTDIGTQIKSNELWDGTNSSGFTLLGSGYREVSGNFHSLNYSGHYRGFSPSQPVPPNFHGLGTQLGWTGVDREYTFVHKGFAVRCVKSEEGFCFDPDGNGVCADNEVFGCTDETACNYNAEATQDDGSCVPVQEAGSSCDDGDDNTFNDAWDAETCACTGTPAVAEDGSGPCSGQTSVTYHGWTYELVELGDQCWFRENLATEQFSNGDPIVFGTQTNWTTYSPRMAYHYDDSAYRHVFGGLYNWGAVNDSRGLCPVGWHEPNRTEFNALVDWMVTEGYDANDMKLPLDSATALAYWEFGSPTNESGFSAMPAGERDPYTGEDLEVNRRAHFWTASQSQNYSYSGEKFNLNLTSDYGFNAVLKFRGASVRCLLGEFAEGCTDPNFVEYDLGAEEDDGSCVTPN